MSKFKPSDFKIKKEPDTEAGPRVMKLTSEAKPVIKDFEFGKLNSAGKQGYAAVKEKYGALAVTDADRKARSQKDARFALNPLLRDPLSVEEEERRVIEQRVRERVSAIEAEVKEHAAGIGYQDGMKKGYEEAFKKFQAEGAARIASFESLINQAESAKQEIFRANERFLMEMIYRIARMVILKELGTDREYVSRLARDLLERVGVRENIRITISQADAETIGKLKQGLEESLGTLKNLNFEVSPKVQQGGCIVETEWNAIDASVEKQLQGVYESLVGGTGQVT